jgi:hypothetical protein
MTGAPATDRPAGPSEAPLPDDPPHVVPRLLSWGILATAVALVHNRLWASPNLDAFSRIAQQWGSDPFSDASTSDYLLTNLSLPTLAHVVGMTDPHRYALLHLIVLLVGCTACVVLAQRQFGYRAARTLLVLLAASPGVTVVFQWLGQPDALTFPLGIALVLVQRRRSFVALAVLAGLTHPEQAVLVVACAAVVRGLVTPPGTYFDLPVARPPWKKVPGLVGGDLFGGLLGVVAARAVVELYLRGFDIGLGRPRSDYLRLGADVLAEHHGRAPWSLVYLLWGPLWLVVVAVVVLRLLAAGRPGADRYAWSWLVLGALSLVALVPVAVTLDETRVYAVLTAPVLAGAAVVLSRELVALHPRGLAVGTGALLAITLVVPGGFTAGEDAWATQIPTDEFVEFLTTGDAPTPLFFWLLGPFDFVFPNVDDG